MSENEKNVPKRRFKEFESAEAWEQRKFGDIVERISTSCATDGLPRVEYEDIVSEQGMLNKDIHQKVSNKSGILFINNDILYGKLRPYLKNWLLAEFEGIAVGDFWVYRSPENDSKFIYSLIQSDLYQTSANMSTGTKMPRADWSVVSNTEFYIPLNIEEQKKIGAFFIDLDNLITLHQLKLDKMKALKKAYLTEMFPAEGERKPKIRFVGFTDDWEQRKFDEEVEFYSGLTYSPNDVSDNGTFVLRSSNVKNGEIVDADNVYVNSEVVNSRNVKEGDIIVVVRNGSRSLIGKHAQVKRKMDKTVIGAFMTGIRSSQSSFINALMDTQQFSGEVEKNLGATINQITNGMFREMRFMFPDIQEQNQIGNFFNNLDNLITIHLRKLEKLKNIKKAYLNEMFI